jgi:hypothetical protein
LYLCRCKIEVKITYSIKRFVPKYAFYEGLLFNKKNGTIRSAIYLDEIVNTAHRKDYIVNDFIQRLAFEKKLALIYAFPDALHQDAKCHEYHERN